MIFDQIKQKPLEYLSLAMTFLTGLVLFIIFSYNPHYQRLIIYILIAVYLVWSLHHHHRRGDLHFSIIIEYIVFSFFALLLLSF